MLFLSFFVHLLLLLFFLFFVIVGGSVVVNFFVDARARARPFKLAAADDPHEGGGIFNQFVNNE